MNKMFKVLILCMSLLFIQSTIFSTLEVQAAEKIMYVKAKSDIVLREKPNKDAKRLGTIPNYSSLKVISTSKGWSYVNTGKKKGYVYTSALVSKNPKVATKVTGGLLPSNNLFLTYSPSLLEEKKETFKVVRENNAAYLIDDSGYGFVYFEEKRGIGLVDYPGGHEIFSATYPMVEGKNSKENYIAGADEYGPVFGTRNILIESTSKTVKVKAGTFKNVVVTKDANGYRNYIAPGVGIIKTTDKAGKTVTELVSLKSNSETASNAELEKVKKSALKGRIPGVEDVKIGGLVRDIEKKYGKHVEEDNIRDEYLIYKYPRFSILFDTRNNGKYTFKSTPTTKVLEIGNEFSKGYTLKEITNIFGEDYIESTFTIGGEGPLIISYSLGDYSITFFSNIHYYVSNEIVVPSHNTVYNLNEFKSYSKIPDMKFTSYRIQSSSY